MSAPPPQNKKVQKKQHGVEHMLEIDCSQQAGSPGASSASSSGLGERMSEVAVFWDLSCANRQLLNARPTRPTNRLGSASMQPRRGSHAALQVIICQGHQGAGIGPGRYRLREVISHPARFVVVRDEDLQRGPWTLEGATNSGHRLACYWAQNTR